MEKTDPQSGENQTNPEGDSSVAETQITTADAIRSPASKRIQISENTEYLSVRNAKLVATERIAGNNLGHLQTVPTEGVSHLVKDKSLCKRRKMALAKSPPLIKAPSVRTPSPFLVPVENACDNLDDDFPFSGYCGSPESFLVLCDVPASPKTEFPLSDYQPKPPTIIEEHRALTQQERHELYNFINDSIGISSGIMEQAGTYTAYMKERTRTYFDRIGSSAYCTTKLFQEAHSGLLSGSNVSADEDIDFGDWLSDYIHEPDENYRADSYEEFKPFKEQATPDVLLEHGSTVHIQGSGYTELPSHLINLGLSSVENPTCRTRYELLHSDCAFDPPATTSQSASSNKSADRAQTPHSTLPRQRRHSTRLRVTSFVHKTTSKLEVFHNTSNLTMDALSEMSNPFSDYNNRLFLHISRPRLRTSSAGGGL